ncbi:MAG: IS200/IS605 family transposase [Candidatus Parcubacteria bacterium]|nr:IS200/IS605 family transposase [Candidatus Parcubacteria bacterium]
MGNRRLYQLDHATYRCEYHLVWVCRYRAKIMADKYIKQELKRIFQQISKWKGLIMTGWHVGDEHVHLVIIIPPKYSILYVMSVIKGKSSSWIKKKTKKIPKGSFWARGYYASTVGLDETKVRNYVKNQEHHQVELPKLPFRFF